MRSINLKKLKKSLDNIKQIAKREKWTIEYNKTIDAFYYSPKRLPNDTRLLSLTDEIALYVTPEAGVKGIFIEHFSTNFVEHHREFKKVFDYFTKTKDQIQREDRRKKQKTTIYKRDLEQSLLVSIYRKETLIPFPIK
jgi:archaellin